MPKVAVRVPASSANLGPGYDSFGLALALYDIFTAEEADDWLVEVGGEGVGELSGGADNLVARAIAHVFAACGHEGRAAHVVCENGIPTGRGLGSSSAAIVGGLVLGNALLNQPLRREELFRMAAELEGHSDNVAAALFGGLTLCWTDAEEPSCVVLQPAPLAVVAVVSDEPLPTPAARRMLPDSVPHADAAFNAGRAGVLIAGLLLGGPELLAVGLEDRLHEPYRAKAVCDLADVKSALLAAGADGAALSGAGPTVVGLLTAADDSAALARAEDVAAAASKLLGGNVSRRTPVVLGIDRSGAVLL